MVPGSSTSHQGEHCASRMLEPRGDTMTVSNGLSQTPWWSSDPAELGGGCKRALERTVFSKGRLQPLARRALLGGLGPRACKGLCRGLSFGSAAPGGTDRGRGACHWLPGGGASCLLVHPGALGQEGENFRLEDGRGAFGARREAPRAPLWSEAKTARTAQPRLSRTPGRTDRMTIDRSPSNLLHRSDRPAESWS